MPQIITGIQNLAATRRRSLRGRRLGLLVHAASVDMELRHTVDLLSSLSDLHIELLMGPEHGIRGEAQDMEPVGTTRDASTGLPVVSLYGVGSESLCPSEEIMKAIDVLVVDLQDVGARYYTYVWTALECLKTARKTSTEVWICDRPNPLGGGIEGGPVKPGFESFVGGHDVPIRHGMTIAEILRLAAAERGLEDALDVVPMEGYRRSTEFEETGCFWVMPSPNMPTLDTALVYPGMCLVEATELSEGRGTTRPFELCGAPHIDPSRLVSLLESCGLPGVRFRSVFFKPTFQKHSGSRCGGVQLHVTSKALFKPYLTGVAVLWAIRSLWPDEFILRQKPYEFVRNRPALDLLSGSTDLREALMDGAALQDLERLWIDEAETFSSRRRPHLLYPD